MPLSYSITKNPMIVSPRLIENLNRSSPVQGHIRRGISLVINQHNKDLVGLIPKAFHYIPVPLVNVSGNQRTLIEGTRTKHS